MSDQILPQYLFQSDITEFKNDKLYKYLREANQIQKDLSSTKLGKLQPEKLFAKQRICITPEVTKFNALSQSDKKPVIPMFTKADARKEVPLQKTTSIFFKQSKKDSSLSKSKQTQTEIQAKDKKLKKRLLKTLGKRFQDTSSEVELKTFKQPN